MTLPSFDGSLVKPKAMSTDRHERETLAKFAEKLQISTATVRRGLYIDDYGTPEIKALLLAGKISIWKAYEATKREEQKRIMEGLKKLHGRKVIE